MLKGVQPKEVTSLVKAPKNEEPAAGNGPRKVQQNFETLETEVQFTKHCQEAAFIREVAVGRFYRTALDVDDGFGDRTPACREYTGPRGDSDSRIFTAIKQRTIIGPFLQVHIITCLGTYGIEIQRPSTTSPKETSREVICRGQNRYVEELPHLEPGPDPTSKEILRERERCCKRKRTFCCRDKPIPHRGNSCDAGTCSCESCVLCERDCSYGRKDVDIPVNKWYQEDALSTEISKCVMRLGRRNDQDEREFYGAVRWGFGGTRISNCVPEARRERFLGLGLDQVHLLGKRQD